MQSVGHPSLTKRALFYASRLYFSQLRKGSDYGDLSPAVVIFILDFIHFSESLQPVSRFGLVERTRGSPLLPEDGEMEAVFLELPKVRQTVDIQSKALSRLEYWLLFLAAQDDETLEIIRMTAHDPDLEDAFSEIEFAALSKKEKQLYQARIDGLRDQRTILREKTAEAMAVGEAKGEAKGRAEGKAEGLAESLLAKLLQRIKLRFGADALKELEPHLHQLKPEDLSDLFDALIDAQDLESARAILAGS